MVEIANNELPKYNRYSELKSSGISDPEVRFISWFIKSNTRKIDKVDCAITYRQLQKILRRYGFDLRHPSKNYINIVQIRKRKKILGLFGQEIEEEIKLGQIGFPRWGAQIGKSALKTAREVTQLTADHGVDSAAFFHGVDSMQSLIGVYQQPLMNLASR